MHLVGTVFLDLVFTALHAQPRAGTEVHTEGLGTSPGGVANTAVALSRLGAEVSLSAAFSGDAFGGYLWARLAEEGVDLSASRMVSNWSTPITVSIANGYERALVTHEAETPVGACDLVPPSLEVGALFVAPPSRSDLAWLRTLDPRPMVYLDCGWDADDRGRSLLAQLDRLDVLLPNELEAKSLAGKDDLLSAAVELGRVCSVVVKAGAQGAVAIAPSGEVVVSGAVPSPVVDTTGAGDIFDAALIYGALMGLRLEDQLAFANLCASLSVRYVGGALAAPCWRDIMAWWESIGVGDELRSRYRFLPDIAPVVCLSPACHRAHPTLSLDELGSIVSSERRLRPTGPEEVDHA